MQCALFFDFKYNIDTIKINFYVLIMYFLFWAFFELNFELFPKSILICFIQNYKIKRKTKVLAKVST